jgi:hypothetical protein
MPLISLYYLNVYEHNSPTCAKLMPMVGEGITKVNKKYLWHTLKLKTGVHWQCF